MSVADLLERCRVAGVSLVADGEVLRVKAAASPPADLLADLKARKADVLAALSEEIAPTRELNLDELAARLRADEVCLVLRDGRLTFTGPDGQGVGHPEEALQAYVEANRSELLACLTTGADTGRMH